MNCKTAKHSRPFKILFVILCISVLIILMLGFSASSPVFGKTTSPLDPFRAVERGEQAKSGILTITGESEFLHESEHLRKFAVLPYSPSMPNVLSLSICLLTLLCFTVIYFTPTTSNVKLNI